MSPIYPVIVGPISGSPNNINNAGNVAVRMSIKRNTAKQAINFEQQLNDALSECQPDEEGYCTISIDVISDSESKITISDIKIDYINTEDRDNDGVEDKQDTVIGDITEIDTNIPELAIAVGNRDITDNYDVIGTPPESQQSVQKIEVKERDKVLVEFDMDLSQKKLYLSSLVIKKQEPDADKGAIVVSGITLDEQETKIIYIDKIDSNSSGVCIKDEEVLSISEISSDCKGQSEVFVSCNDIDVNGYSCIEETQRYKITTLKRTRIKYKIGSLKPEKFKEVLDKLISFLRD